MSKKILSIVLALVMVLAMGVVAFSVSADLSELPEQPEGTYRYYFYMPDQWLNDSTATTGNTAGIYWWEGTDAHGSWPGIAANKADVPGVYYYDVPTDVTTVIWNNFFDGGSDVYAEYYADAIQTANIGTEYYDPGESDLYPDGTENFDGMIYVTDFGNYDYNDYSGKMIFYGEWFYYYGNGEYGTAPVKGDSEVYTDSALNPDLPFPSDKHEETTEATVDEPTTEESTAAPVDPSTEETTETPSEIPTDAPVVEPEGCTTDITFGDTTKSACVGDTITYTMDLTAARLFENIQAVVSYDSTVIELVRIKSDAPDIEDWEVEGPERCPNLDGVIFNAGTAGVVKFNASKVSGYNFKTEKNLVTLEFTVVAEGNATIATVIEEMTIKGDGTESYFTGGQAVITEGITIVENLVVPEHEFEPTTEESTAAPVEPTTEESTAAPVEPTTEESTAAPVEPTTEESTAAPVEPTTANTTAAPADPTDAPAEPTEGPTSATDAPADEDIDAPTTGAAAYIIVAIALMAMVAGAVVVLRKKAND